MPAFSNHPLTSFCCLCSPSFGGVSAFVPLPFAILFEVPTTCHICPPLCTDQPAVSQDMQTLDSSNHEDSPEWVDQLPSLDFLQESFQDESRRYLGLLVNDGLWQSPGYHMSLTAVDTGQSGALGEGPTWAFPPGSVGPRVLQSDAPIHLGLHS